MDKFILNKENIETLTLEDAFEIYKNDGVGFIFGDGKLKCFIKERKEII